MQEINKSKRTITNTNTSTSGFNGKTRYFFFFLLFPQKQLFFFSKVEAHRWWYSLFWYVNNHLHLHCDITLSFSSLKMLYCVLYLVYIKLATWLILNREKCDFVYFWSLPVSRWEKHLKILHLTTETLYRF